MKNSEIRAWYRRKVAEISKLDLEWVAQGLNLEKRARRAWKIRRQARLQARAMMEVLSEVEALQERDRRLYGNPHGPSFDQLLKQGQEMGLSQDDIYERIIKGAQITNRETDRLFPSESSGPSTTEESS
jgi:hypothetical protein